MNQYRFFWLALRLMRKQKLRTLTLFSGGLSASFLLYTFCGMGYYFWEQVHSTSSGDVSYGFGQYVLAALAAVLLAVVCSCSVILLQSLFALTFEQKWRSLNLLRILGACTKDLIFMAAAELCILFCTAIPLGMGLAVFISVQIGLYTKLPVWLVSSIGLWIFGIFFCSGFFPFCKIVFGPIDVSCRCLQSNTRHAHSRCKKQKKTRVNSFVLFMSGRYHTADRKRHRRITLTMVAAIILYVPASYLLHTNIRMNQAGLYEKYGIEYSSFPDDEVELKKSIEECRNLTAAVPVDSVFYVEMHGTVCVASELLSNELLSALEEAGWPGNSQFEADGTIYFLEDACYDTYWGSGGQAVLVNRYINRASYSKDASAIQAGRAETALLSPDAKKALNEARIQPCQIKVYGGVFMDIPASQMICQQIKAESKEEANHLANKYAREYKLEVQGFMPDACTDKLPEGIDVGNAAVIIPLSRMQAVCTDIGMPFQNLHVCGLFADTEKNLFERLQQSAGPGALGELRNNRKAYQEWYDSLHDIQTAMLCICGVLFFTAIFQVFVVLIFHCMQRRHGLAVLWSLGQTKQRLSLILILESVRAFVCASLAAIPISCMLCVGIYRLYRNVWNTGFVLPYGQLFLSVAVMALVSAAAVFVSFYQIQRQDFLKEVRGLFRGIV